MKNIFNESNRKELVNRINHLENNSIPLWGKMNLYQMILHCKLWDGMVQGNIDVKRHLTEPFPGELFLNDALKNPMIKNAQASPELIVKETEGDISSQKKDWIVGIESYSIFRCNEFIHPFFGKMTKEQIGILAYKHTDHHLRQFSV